MPVSIEQHVEWITDCIKYLSGAGTIEATDEAEDAWVQHTAEIADMTMFSKADSWYVDADVAGKTRVFMPYVGGVANYRDRSDTVASNGYEGFRISA